MPKKKDKVKGKTDYMLWYVFTCLLVFGLIMVFSASMPSSLEEYGNSYSYFMKQILYVGFSIVVGVFVLFLPEKLYKSKIITTFALIVVTALLAYTGLYGSAAGGARRWIAIKSFSFQPSEVAKVVFILFFAAYLTWVKEKEKIKSFVWGFAFPIVFCACITGVTIYYLQNHLSATVIICTTVVVQVFVAGSRLSYWLASATIGGVAGGLKLWQSVKEGFSTTDTTSFRKGRIAVWWNPWLDPRGKGWQPIQSMYAIASGGFWGLGLGQSKQKYLYLSEAQNDFIFAIVGEELGFLGCLIVLLLFVVFIWRGIHIARNASDLQSTLIAIGITVMIGIQAIMNVAVVTNTIPVTGVTLPFFSYGGTAVIIDILSVFLLQNIARNSKVDTNN